MRPTKPVRRVKPVWRVKIVRFVPLLAAIALAGCSALSTRTTEPLDKPVLPLRPGAVTSATHDAAPATSDATGPGAPVALRSYVILLADDDGSVGRLDVESGGKQIVLDEANRGVDFADLSQTFEAAAAEKEVFARALAAEPPPSVQWVVHFELSAVEPSSAETARVRGLLEPVRAWAAPEVTIAGHTDRRGDPSRNQTLSKLRAEAVSRLLVREGIVPVALEVMAFGESYPAVDTPDGTAEPRNRRVVVTIR